MKKSMFLRLLQIAGLALASLVLHACGSNASYEGDGFEAENLDKIREGMSVEEVEELLGAPYTIITSLVTEEVAYEYEYTKAKSVVAGVLYLRGVFDIEGNKAKISFDRNRRVKKIQYEIIGEGLYEEFRQ